MAASMNIAPQLQAAIIERLSDEDHLVCVEAAKALMQCPTEEARQARKIGPQRSQYCGPGSCGAKFAGVYARVDRR